MIDVTEARKRISLSALPGRKVLLSLTEANNYILAEDVYAPMDTPPFDQSAMDGYAFSFDKWNKSQGLKIVGEVQAGNVGQEPIPEASAVRIYTGAPLPPGTDTVVMQEKVILNQGFITLDDALLQKGTNVRPMGSQTRKGALAMQKGQALTPAAIAYLAGTGVDEVVVYTKPVIHMIATGKELVRHPKDLLPGKILESNTIGLNAVLQQLHIQPARITITDDDESEITAAITSSLSADIIILTGGVSVGDYDLVPAALAQCGVDQIFHKVKQKPGKPFYFGKKETTLVFALPGNPGAALTCFYEYVVPLIEAFTHQNYNTEQMVTLLHDFSKKPGLTHFLKGLVSNEGVTILDHQESYLLNSFAVANCLVELGESIEHLQKGEQVRIKRIGR